MFSTVPEHATKNRGVETPDIGTTKNREHEDTISKATGTTINQIKYLQALDQEENEEEHDPSSYYGYNK